MIEWLQPIQTYLLVYLFADSGAIYRLEGYLFPAVYDYYDDTTIEDLVEQMISTTDARLQPYYEAIANKNLTVNEVLTLASLVEKRINR